MSVPDLQSKFANALYAAPPIPLATKRAGSDGALGLVEGYGSTFGTIDYFGQAVAPGAFGKSLARHKTAGTTPAFLWSHDPAEPIGRFTSIKEDAKGLFVTGIINQETQRGREALALLKARDISGLSIGFMPVERRMDKNGVTVLTEIELLEISAVALPANVRAVVTDVKGIGDIRAYESFLHESGFPKAACRKLAVGGWRALNDNDSAEIAELAELVRSSTAQFKNKE